MFDHVGSFQSAIVALERERRYRIFADLEQQSCSIAPTCFGDVGGKLVGKSAVSRSLRPVRLPSKMQFNGTGEI
jgi:hypothetical protein